jgi:hypothetical protein
MDKYVVRTKSPGASPVKRQREEEQELRSAGAAGAVPSLSPVRPTPLSGESPTKKARVPRSLKGKGKETEGGEEGEEDEEAQVIAEVKATPTTPTKRGTTTTPPISPTKVSGMPPGVLDRWKDHGMKGMEAVRLLDGGLLRRHAQFLDSEEAASLFDTLMRDIKWLQADVTVYGKTYKYHY